MDTNGLPIGRNVLLKEIHGGGFVFFTNYKSNKASDMKSITRLLLSSVGMNSVDK